MKFEITYRGQLEATPEFPGEDFDRDAVIERAFDETMRELVKLDCADPSVSGSISSGDIEISVVAEGDDHVAAFAQADPCIRAALHAAGVGTKGWETQSCITVEFSNYDAEPVPVG
jgi:hypothetical protein